VLVLSARLLCLLFLLFPRVHCSFPLSLSVQASVPPLLCPLPRSRTEGEEVPRFVRFSYLWSPPPQTRPQAATNTAAASPTAVPFSPLPPFPSPPHCAPFPVFPTASRYSVGNLRTLIVLQFFPFFTMGQAFAPPLNLPKRLSCFSVFLLCFLLVFSEPGSAYPDSWTTPVCLFCF